MCVRVRMRVHGHVFPVMSKAYFRGKHFKLENDRIRISSEEWSLLVLLKWKGSSGATFSGRVGGGEGFAEDICPRQVLGHNKITYVSFNHPALSKDTLSTNEEKSAVPAKY